VPFLVKDLYTPVKGWPMTNGSRWFGRRVSEDDDELVRRYLGPAGLFVVTEETGWFVVGLSINKEAL